MLGKNIIYKSKHYTLNCIHCVAISLPSSKSPSRNKDMGKNLNLDPSGNVIAKNDELCTAF